MIVKPAYQHPRIEPPPQGVRWIYRCRRCGVAFRPTLLEVGLAHPDLSIYAAMGAAAIDGMPRTCNHRCDPVETEGVPGIGIADLIGCDTEGDGR